MQPYYCVVKQHVTCHFGKQVFTCSASELQCHGLSYKSSVMEQSVTADALISLISRVQFVRMVLSITITISMCGCVALVSRFSLKSLHRQRS